jgi:hypothetical protein
MLKVGQGPSVNSAPKPQPAQSKATPVKQVSAQQLSSMLGALKSAAVPTPPVASKVTAVSASPAMTAALAQPMAAPQEVLPVLLAPLPESKMYDCINQAFIQVFEGDKLPNRQERDSWMAFAVQCRADDPTISAEKLRSVIASELRKQRDGLDTITPDSIIKYIQDGVSWTSQCYEGTPRGASPAEVAEWSAFAQKKLAEKPDMTPEQLKYAIQDAIRAKMTGMTAGPSGGPNIDKFINDAVSWVAQCYQGGPRDATKGELDHWRAFAAQKQAEKPDMTPEQLKYAIQDAVRARATGMEVGANGRPDIDKFINDAVSWVAQCYQGAPRDATTNELNDWRQFAEQKLAEKPDMTPEQLKYAIQDAVRARATGMEVGANGKPDIDKFINDAVSWVATCYQGGPRDATPGELSRWRAFADQKLAEKPDMTPEQLKYAIQDAVRDEARGVGGPAGSADLTRFITDAYQWVFELYRNQPANNPRKPTDREIREWTAYAKTQLANKPEMTAEDLKYLIQDGLRTALGNI